MLSVIASMSNHLDMSTVAQTLLKFCDVSVLLSCNDPVHLLIDLSRSGFQILQCYYV